MRRDFEGTCQIDIVIARLLLKYNFFFNCYIRMRVVFSARFTALVNVLYEKLSIC